MEGTGGDSTFTSVQLTGGAGSYAYITRGCEGEILSKEAVPFRDAGFSVDHRGLGPVQVGMKGGWYSESRRMGHWRPNAGLNAYYLNPNVALEWRRFGIGLGPLLAEAPLHDFLLSDENGYDRGIKALPTGHIRVGSRKAYFSAHLLEGLPLVSGGGFMAGGFGFSPGPGASIWIGLTTPLPYDGMGALGQAAIPVARNTHLRVGLRIGQSNGVSECAGSLGLDHRWISAR
jgi:hypothetical protein